MCTYVCTYIHSLPFEMQLRLYIVFFPGDFTVKGVVPTVDGEASKIKVKARLNIHGIFSIITATLYEKIEEPPPVEQPEASQQEQPMNEDQAKSKGDSEEPPKQTDTNSTDSPPQTDGPQSPEDVTPKEEGQPEPSDRQNGSEQPQEPNSQPSEGEDSLPSQQKMETESSATKEEKVEPPRKKQVKPVSLVVDSATTALSKCGLDDVTEKEVCLHVHSHLFTCSFTLVHMFIHTCIYVQSCLSILCSSMFVYRFIHVCLLFHKSFYIGS